MMSFLSPLALFGLATLAVPIVIHLFKPKRVRVVSFSSLRWLRASQQRLSKRIQWHQLLLFLLRAATLALLVLAAARPMLMRRGGSRSAQRFVIIDATRSMGYESPQGPNALVRAKGVAVDLLSEGGAGDHSAVCVVGNQARALGPLTPDPSVFLDAIAKLNVEAGELPLTDALRLIPLFQRGKPPPELIELFFLTCNLDASWRQSDIRAFIRDANCPVRVTVLSMADADLQNAWIVAADVLQGPTPQTQLLRVQIQANDAQITKRTVNLTGVHGFPDTKREVVLEAGRPSWATFELPSNPENEWKTGLLSLAPADSLPDDDRLWVDLAPRGQQTVLLIEAETTQVRELRPAFHLRTALETLAETTPGRFGLLYRTPDELQEQDLQRADWIFWVEPKAISASALAALKARVGAGAGVAIFAGPTTDLAYCNDALFAEPPADALLTRKFDGIVTAGEKQPRVKLTGIQWLHPLLAPFADPVYGDLPRAMFNAYVKLVDPGTVARDRVLATFPDQTPAILESDFGAGRVLLINATANDAWSDFPRHRGFLPWVDGLLGHLNGTAHGRRLNVGDSAYLLLGEFQETRPLRFTDPGGKSLQVTVQPRAGKRVVQSAPLIQPGVYTLSYTTAQGETVEEPVIVQVGRAQSRLVPADPEVLEEWWAPSAFSLVVPETQTRGQGGGMLRNSLELIFLCLALALFFCETILASQLCPRANPKIESASTVAMRGFFRGQMDAPANPEAAGEDGP